MKLAVPLPHNPEALQPSVIVSEGLVRAEAMVRASAMLRSLFGPTILPEQVTEPPILLAQESESSLAITVEPDTDMASELKTTLVSTPVRRHTTPRKSKRGAAKSAPKPLLQIQLSPPDPVLIPGMPLKEDTMLGYDESMPEFYDSEPGSWEERAVCAQVDPELFFPEKGGTTRPAKKICEGCEVKSECLQAALQRDERFGIWGGLSERERRRLKRLGGSALVNLDAETSALDQPYSRVKQLVDILESADDEGEQRESIENTLHEDEQQLKKLVQGTLAWYKADTGDKLTKGALDRLFRYFTGEKLWAICTTAGVQTLLGKEIQTMTDFFDEAAEEGMDPLMICWERSVSTESPFNVLHHIEPKPKWQKDAMLVERQAATM